MDIPVINFNNCNIQLQDVAEASKLVTGNQIYEAFATVGFVYLKNTGIESWRVEKLNQKADEFYQLETSVKTKFNRNEANYGYVGIDVESINPDRPGDFKEAFNVTGDAIVSESTNWPDDLVPNFSTEMKSFCELCRQLSARLLDVLATGMKLEDKDYFLRCHSRMNSINNFTTLRSLHYPPIPSDLKLKEGQIRLGEHSDYGSLTLLFQDDVGGLQVETYDGEFIEAHPIPGTVLVNIGDILQFWTNGRLKSTTHRVLMPLDEEKKRKHRRSVAYFVHPDHEVFLSEIKYKASEQSHHRTGEKDQSAEPITAFEHVDRKLKASYLK